MEKASRSDTQTWIKKHLENATQHRGYIIDDQGDLALDDVARGLDVIAFLCDQNHNLDAEITTERIGCVLRVFSRATEHIRNEAAWTNSAMATPRNLQ